MEIKNFYFVWFQQQLTTLVAVLCNLHTFSVIGCVTEVKTKLGERDGMWCY